MKTAQKATIVLTVCCLLLSSFSAVAQAAPAKRAQWTLAIYLASDNNLTYWAEKDVDEMKMVGSTKDVNVLIFWDRYDGPAHAYRVLRGDLEELTDFALNGKEPNMGDPATLEQWVSYTRSKFPSEKYALIGWDHGDDFRGGMYDNHIPDEGFDLLTHQEVVEALAGFHIDVLMYAACVMQTIEVVYEYFAGGLDIDYYVATEGYDPLNGSPYDQILANLTATPTQSPLDFSTMLVDEYIYYYQYVVTGPHPGSEAVTLSVVQTDKIGQVVTDLRSMTEAIMADMEGYAGIVSAASGHANLPWSEHGWERLDDLPTFVNTIHDKSLDPKEVKGIAPSVVESVVLSSETLLKSLDDAILYHRSLEAMEKKGCLGIGIYFPTSYESYIHNPFIYGKLYPQMAFAEQGWLDFMFAYWAIEP